LLAGAATWLGSGGSSRFTTPSDVSPAALYAATFTDPQDGRVSLGRYQGKVVVVNFWATWCAPCREEMPLFGRLQARWAARGVQFVGLSNEDPALVQRFGHNLGVAYPLWVGGEEVGELARRLGNGRGFLPFTALVDRRGRVVEVRVGPYTEALLESRLARISAK
jgi:thiol-disulfide isomerase/thioredoxin